MRALALAALLGVVTSLAHAADLDRCTADLKACRAGLIPGCICWYKGTPHPPIPPGWTITPVPSERSSYQAAPTQGTGLGKSAVPPAPNPTSE
jgi:hypothetical protein